MNHTLRNLTVAGACGLIFLTCLSTALAEKGDRVVPAKLGATRNVHAAGKHILSGQPEPADFEEAKKRGVKAVINLRTASELNWDEGKKVKGLGMTYHPLGFRAPDTLTDDIIAKSVKVMADQPVLLHCASANRVGAIWMAHRVINDGLEVEAAAAEAKTVGLRTPGYESKIRAYLKKNPKKNDK